MSYAVKIACWGERSVPTDLCGFQACMTTLYVAKNDGIRFKWIVANGDWFSYQDVTGSNLNIAVYNLKAKGVHKDSSVNNLEHPLLDI